MDMPPPPNTRTLEQVGEMMAIWSNFFAPGVGVSHDFATSAPPPPPSPPTFKKKVPKGDPDGGFLAFGATSRQIPTLSQTWGRGFN